MPRASSWRPVARASPAGTPSRRARGRSRRDSRTPPCGRSPAGPGTCPRPAAGGRGGRRWPRRGRAPACARWRGASAASIPGGIAPAHATIERRAPRRQGHPECAVAEQVLLVLPARLAVTGELEPVVPEAVGVPPALRDPQDQGRASGVRPQHDVLAVPLDPAVEMRVLPLQGTRLAVRHEGAELQHRGRVALEAVGQHGGGHAVHAGHAAGERPSFDLPGQGGQRVDGEADRPAIALGMEAAGIGVGAEVLARCRRWRAPPPGGRAAPCAPPGGGWLPPGGRAPAAC